MNPEEIHRLIEEYRDGTISADDARRLAEAIRADAGIAATVRRDLAFSGQLGQSLEDADNGTFVRSFSERLRAERGGHEFMIAFEKRTSLRSGSRTRRVEAPRPSLVPFLVAAALLLAVLAAMLSLGGQPSPVQVVKKEIPSPSEEPKFAPPPAPLPPPDPPVRPPEEPHPVPPPPVAPVPPPKPEEPRPPDPVKPVEEPKPAPVKPTEVVRILAVARLDRVEGDVFLATEGERKPARAGQEILPGMSVVTGPANGRATFVLADGTRVGVDADTTIREIAKGPRGTRVVLGLGTVTADVARQPADQPLVFATPHAEARVLGTVLRLVVEATSTRLEVKEGKVKLTRDGKSADVSKGQFAVAGPGAAITPRALSPDEIVLLPQQAKLTGAEWSLLRDPKSLVTGWVLEAGSTPFKVVDHVQTRTSYATFTFFAPADKEYRIWIRAASQEKGDPWNRDMVTIEPTRATLNQKSPFFGEAPTTAWVVTGVSATPGFSWISGHGEEAKAQVPPLVVKFHETGFQNLRLYVGHPWVRIDAIWLSATLKARPNAKVVPPFTEK